MKEFYLWLGWNCEKFEHHLEEMAQNGWRLKSAKLGITVLEYERQEPSKVRFCLDYNPKYTVDALTIIRDDGWKDISNSSGWWLWEKEYQTDRPNLFSDKSSLLERDKRLLFFLLILFATQFPLIVVNFSNHYERNLHSFDFLMVLVSTVYPLFLIFWIYGMIKLYMGIRKYSN